MKDKKNKDNRCESSFAKASDDRCANSANAANESRCESATNANEIEQLKKQAEENLAGWQRARADYDNLKKDTAKEKAEFAAFANANLLMELLPIMDNFNAAFKSVPEAEKQNAWVVGLGHIKKQMEDFLKNNGIESIKTVGEKFDPELHEAVSKEKVEGTDADIILKEVKAGYKLHGKIIQAAKVVVRSGE